MDETLQATLEAYRVFTEEDITLLKQPLPPYPCSMKCYGVDDCTCCTRKQIYIQQVKPYSDKHLLTIAEMLRTRTELLEIIQGGTERITQIEEALPIDIRRELLF